MNLSMPQTVITCVGLLVLALLTGLHDVDGNVTVPVVAAVLANALGYVNGKAVAKKEVNLVASTAATTANAMTGHTDDPKG